MPLILIGLFAVGLLALASRKASVTTATPQRATRWTDTLTRVDVPLPNGWSQVVFGPVTLPEILNHTVDLEPGDLVWVRDQDASGRKTNQLYRRTPQGTNQVLAIAGSPTLADIRAIDPAQVGAW